MQRCCMSRYGITSRYDGRRPAGSSRNDFDQFIGDLHTALMFRRPVLEVSLSEIDRRRASAHGGDESAVLSDVLASSSSGLKPKAAPPTSATTAKTARRRISAQLTTAKRIVANFRDFGRRHRRPALVFWQSLFCTKITEAQLSDATPQYLDRLLRGNRMVLTRRHLNATGGRLRRSIRFGSTLTEVVGIAARMRINQPRMTDSIVVETASLTSAASALTGARRCFPGRRRHRKLSLPSGHRSSRGENARFVTWCAGSRLAGKNWRHCSDGAKITRL